MSESELGLHPPSSAERRKTVPALSDVSPQDHQRTTFPAIPQRWSEASTARIYEDNFDSIAARRGARGARVEHGMRGAGGLDGNPLAARARFGERFGHGLAAFSFVLAPVALSFDPGRMNHHLHWKVGVCLGHAPERAELLA